MDDSLSSAISQLQNMLSTDEGKKNIEDMLGSLGMGESSSPVSDNNFLNPENMLKIKGIMDSFNRRDDPRSQLLLALKPYLSSTRSARLDTAIRLLSLGKLPNILNTFKGQG